MKIGDKVYVRGYIEEIRRDIVIIGNDSGFFGTSKDEIFTYEEDERGYGTMNEADHKTENSSEFPNNFDKDINVRSKDETQTDDLFTDRFGDVWEWRGDAWHCISGEDEPQTDCAWK